MHPSRLLPLVLLLPLALLAGGCGGVLGCTDNLVIFRITVLDSDGDPAEGVEVTVTNVRTGDVVPLADHYDDHTQPGQYTILTDSQVPEHVRSGDEIRVTGTLDGASFTETYAVEADACHITEVAGPTEVQLQR